MGALFSCQFYEKSNDVTHLVVPPVMAEPPPLPLGAEADEDEEGGGEHQAPSHHHAEQDLEKKTS